MSYDKKMRENILNDSNWPTFKKPEYLDELYHLAQDAVASTERFSPISAILIYQQLVEEVLRLLLDQSNFLLQAKMWPWKIEVKPLKKAMFGRVVEEINNSVEFQHKDKILVLANEINAMRIDVAHGLSKTDSIETFRNKSIEVEKKFHELFNLYKDTDEWFKQCFGDLRSSLANNEAPPA